MIIKDVILNNETGLHARPASVFVKEASKFKAAITIEKDGKEFNAKSIMGILSMGAGKGDKITIKAEGDGAEQAVENLVALVENNFNE